MKEHVLQALWRYGFYQADKLRTIDGKKVTVQTPGVWNADAGPDFSNARLLIDNVLWIGGVELHIRTSDWDRHNHSTDKAYHNVILHIVLEHDLPLAVPASVPILELKNYINLQAIEAHPLLNESRHLSELPCLPQAKELGNIYLIGWQERLLTERLQEKANRILKYYEEVGQHFGEAVKHTLFTSFGFFINGEAMAELSRCLPYKLLLKHSSSQQQAEALLFGAAGLLPLLPPDDYSKSLVEEWERLQYQHRELRTTPTIWLKGKTRSSNLPCIRLSQLAALLVNIQELVSRLLNVKAEKEGHNLLEVTASPFWNKRTSFSSSQTKKQLKVLGKTARVNLLINWVAPVQVAHSMLTGNVIYQEQAAALLQALPSENNRYTRLFQNMPLTNENAAESQSLLYLYRNYCSSLRCFDCTLGVKLLRRSIEIPEAQLNILR